MKRRLQLPAGISIVEGPHGPRFRGSAHSLIFGLTDVFRHFSHQGTGTISHVGKYVFGIADEMPIMTSSDAVYLPADAWNIFASKIGEVASGREESPFDFGMCGYLYPRPRPDVGVELVGDPMYGA